MNYLDLFSGIGGFRLGLQKAGIVPEYEAHSEIDKYAKQIYSTHFSNSEDLGDVRTIKPSAGKLNGKKINIITFGFPCQDLSIAGKGAGLAGNRSGLFFEAIRLIEELQPEIFIFENVKGLYSSGGGADFTTVLRTIADIGLYDCQWQLLNTRWFLPQNRERIYFVGSIRTKPAPQIFPFAEEDGKINEPSKPYTYAIDANYHKGPGNKAQRSLVCISHNGHKDKEPTISEHCPTLKAESHGHTPMVMVNSATAAGCEAAEVGDSINLSVPNSKTRRGRVGKKLAQTLDTQCNQAVAISTVGRATKKQNGKRTKDNEMFTLTAQDNHGVYDGVGIRRLTPIECERLQGFPDNWTAGVSETQRYKCLGNAVSVPIPEEIFKRIYKA